MSIERLVELSEGMAAAAARAAPWVVRVEGRRRGPASGAVWSADGLIVAAAHALEREEELAVGLEGGETVPAELVGRDPGIDVAVLRVARGGLAPAEWSEAAPRPGQLLLGLSRPGRGLRVALGVVARVGPEWRTPAGGRLERYLEADLPLRPGLSGGLLLDAGGRALGLSAGGLARGAALGIPPEALRRAVKAILAHGGVRRGFLGISTLPVRLPGGTAREQGQEAGLLVTGVEPGSPAERAGLLLGDTVLRAAGQAVAHPSELLPFLEEERIGEPLALRTLRAGALREVPVTVGARPGRRP
ncbi:MAG: serine protease [Deltaproteobacteria bacterium]|nr:serine protease [Deltaproteobacteria bacterium]